MLVYKIAQPLFKGQSYEEDLDIAEVRVVFVIFVDSLTRSVSLS